MLTTPNQWHVSDEKLVIETQASDIKETKLNQREKEQKKWHLFVFRNGQEG